jgi:hypothetical protein
VHLQEPKVLIMYTEPEIMSRILCWFLADGHQALFTIQAEKFLRNSLKLSMYCIGN